VIPVSSKARIAVIAALAAVAIALAFALFSSGGEDESYRGSTPPEGIELPAFSLTDDQGQVVDSNNLDGKVTAVTFLDTQCTQACPVIASAVGRALDRLTEEERGDVVALALSVDPAEDTPEAVGAFLERHRVRGDLHYLVAPEDELRPVWEAFRITPSVDGGSDDLHSAPVRIFDRDGVWVATLNAGADLTPENLAHDLAVALDN
jgi:protein SCO1